MEGQNHLRDVANCVVSFPTEQRTRMYAVTMAFRLAPYPRYGDHCATAQRAI